MNEWMSARQLQNWVNKRMDWMSDEWVLLFTVNVWPKGWMNEWPDEWMIEWMSAYSKAVAGWVSERMDYGGMMNEWINVRTNRWMSERPNEWMNEKINTAHCNENSIYVFLFWELRGLSPNFHIHVSVSDLYFPRIGLSTYFPAAE
jgi:hypothetical protein